MKLPFRRTDPSGGVSSIEGTSVPPHRAQTRTHDFAHHLATTQRSIRLIAFFVGMLLIAVILPTSPVRRALGYGGGSGFISPTCGQPAQVFAKLLKGEKYTVPSKAQLMQLPTPEEKPIVTASDANYDPTTNQLCAGGWVALSTRFANPLPSVQGSTNYDPNYGFTSNTVSNVLGGLWTSFQQWLRDSLQSLIDDAMTFGFLFNTPAGLSYGNTVVGHLQDWMLLLTDSALALFLVIGGYRYMFGAYKDFRDFAPGLIVAAIIANFSLPILGQFIEMSNTICTGIHGVLLTAGFGKLSLPLALINWTAVPDYIIIVYLVELVCTVLLCGQILLRLAFLCLLLVTAPIGLFLCFGGGFILPGARQWGTLWAQAFVATLIAQPLQILCLGLGSALIGSFGLSTLSPIPVLVGSATIFLAWKIPDLLLSSVIRSRILSSQSASEMTQNVVTVVQTGTEMAALIAA